MKNIFKEYISELINNEKDLFYEWGNDNSKITFQKKTPEGFEITINYDRYYIYLFTDRGYHNQFKVNNNFNDVLIDVMGIVRDLLSNNMRIREYLSNNEPYKWELEYFENNKWKSEGSTTLIFWNYFGKRSEQIYFNDILPARDIKLISV